MGIGQRTYVAVSLMKSPDKLSMAEARKEAEIVIIGALDQLFTKTQVKAKDIGILVVNCGLFCPTLSFCCGCEPLQAQRQYFKLQPRWYGCSAGLI